MQKQNDANEITNDANELINDANESGLYVARHLENWD